MPRARIVLETSERRKSAIASAASLQGSSISDLFEEYLVTALPPDSVSPKPAENATADHLGEPDIVLKPLIEQDWSFTHDDTQYLTHDLHPYPAKFIPQIPAHLISQLSTPGDIVLDPFGGCATTAVEAVRLGRRALSLDANPLSAIIGRVKTGFMTPDVRTDLEQLYAAVESHIASFEGSPTDWTQSLIDRFHSYIPAIPNLDKWFSEPVIAELCLIRHLIERTTERLSRDAANLALSRIIIRVSHQESETRYVSIHKQVSTTLTLRAYCESLKVVFRRLETASVDLQFADARYYVGDSRHEIVDLIGQNSVDLIVTSPPYPNATDYHLYHRFRLFWLGFDPRRLSHIEIGSHLRHQRNNTGFNEYVNDIERVLDGCYRALIPGRYAVFVVGDAIFKGELFSTEEAIMSAACEAGLIVCNTIARPIHMTKRSFSKPARRARSEQIVILRKPNTSVTVRLSPPNYRMWEYERVLRCREIESVTGVSASVMESDGPIVFQAQQPVLSKLRRLTFTSAIQVGDGYGIFQPTWQAALEYGDGDPKTRKDPKYVTHGLHSFKGKFYPQLAKSLLNVSGTEVGGTLFDPYCGSGTSLLEGMLNGFSAYGCDLNPLAAKIARAKTAILTVRRDVVDSAIRSTLDRLSSRTGMPRHTLDQFSQSVESELVSWFPLPVLYKLNWLLGQVRLFGDRTLVDFFEVVVSGVIREISFQDPHDLRIRRRKDNITDAPVLALFRDRLKEQYQRLRKYWLIAGRQPSYLATPHVVQGDSRLKSTTEALGLAPATVDCVLTSPPYATALPYIDTDRLSLMAIMGLSSTTRAHLEQQLTGSREIRRRSRALSEQSLLDHSAYESLPPTVVDPIRSIFHANRSVSVGFRRANMAALLWRYFNDIKDTLRQVNRLLKPGAKAFYVVGNSRTKAGDNWVTIDTCENITRIAIAIGLESVQSIGISVTKDNLRHTRNAITKNQIIVLRKPLK